MWLCTNKTAYAAERSWIQDKDANRIWIVAVKATYDIQPDGTTNLADKQEPVLLMGKPRGEFGATSLVYESDLLGLKPCTDVLVNGSAWAPRGKTASSVDVELVAGPIQKSLRVFGDRVWEPRLAGNVSMSPPAPFESMPIIFERAYGGWDRSASDPKDHRMESRNPVGTGFAVRVEGCLGKAAPNVEHPDQLIRSWNDRPVPVGLNAVDCAWSPRRELAGTYDERWQKTRFPLWAEDYDVRYANAAPQDQQVSGYLKGGEYVQLRNLTPGGSLQFTLPRVYPFFRTRFGNERVEHRGRLSTVIIEPDVPRVMMVWQTSLVCNRRVDELDETVVTEKRVI